jgi:LysR family transcriptional regulator of gallate degradation
MEPTPFDLNLRHLRALSSIVARGSMSAAADAVSLSQPALTQGLAKLERQLGVALFERRPDGMIATPEGLLLTERSRAAFAHLAAASRTIARSGPRGFAQPEQLMTATQLHAFLALADAGSFLGAAQATGLSQPALHRAVRDLEQVSAVPLVERRGRGVALTQAGRRLARGARLAAGEIAAAIAETRSDGSNAGSITVGAMPLSRAHLLPAAIARLARTAPGVLIDVVEGSWRELVEPLRDGVIDLMIGALRDEPPPDLAQTPLMEAPLAVIGRAGHPLARSMITTEALGDYPWIVNRGGAPLRAQWEQLFEGRDLPPAPIECGSVMVIRGILRESDFLTLLSPDQVAMEIEHDILAAIGEPLAGTQRIIGITTRANWRPTGMQARFLDLLHEVAG